MRLPGPIVTCIGTRQEAECWEGLKRYLDKADEDPLSQLGARGRVMSASHLQVRVEEGNDPQTGVLRGRGSAFACVVEPWRVADGDEQALGAQQPGSDLGRRLRTGLVDEPMVLGLEFGGRADQETTERRRRNAKKQDSRRIDRGLPQCRTRLWVRR